MRVAIIQEHIDTRRGGAETSTLEMARQLALLGLDVTVVCADSPQLAHAPSIDGISVHPVDVGSGTKLARTVRFVRETDLFCRDERFDIVHAVTPCFSCNVYQPRGGTYVETVERSIARAATPTGRLLKRLGRRLNRRQRFLTLVERSLLNDRRQPHVAAVSDYVRRQVASAFPSVPSEKLHVVFNGVDLAPLDAEAMENVRQASRQVLEVDEQTHVLLFVAHNFRLKGFGELIQALARLERSDWLLVVAGRDDPRPYRRMADKMSVDGQVRFLGASADVRSLYCGADLLTHPTWYDPCSRVVLEALCHGLPVVTTAYNGAAEAMESPEAGVVIESPDRIDDLAAAIGETLKTRPVADRHVMSLPLRDRLSMARHARELSGLYERIVSTGG